MGALQPGHLIVVLVIVLLIFGPGKLPELGKAVGDGLRELKKATGGEDHKETATLPAATAAAAPCAPRGSRTGRTGRVSRADADQRCTDRRGTGLPELPWLCPRWRQVLRQLR